MPEVPRRSFWEGAIMKTEEAHYTRQWEEDGDLQEDYTLEEWLEKKRTQCQCPMCEGTNIGPGYY